MKKLKTGVTTKEVNNRIEVDSPYWQDKKEDYKLTSEDYFIIVMMLFVTIMLILNIEML